MVGKFGPLKYNSRNEQQKKKAYLETGRARYVKRHVKKIRKKGHQARKKPFTEPDKAKGAGR